MKDYLAIIPTLLKLGAKFTPCYGNGKFVDYKQWSEDIDTIRGWARRYDLFRFRPHEAGFLCFDLDHKNGKDGVAGWYGLLKLIYGNNIPANLRTIEGLPCYVKTPSGGYHLYFRQEQPIDYSLHRLPKGVEIKHGQKQWLNVGKKPNGTYDFTGDVAEALPLPTRIRAFIQTPQQRIQPINRPKTPPSAQEILDRARNSDKYGSGKHDIITHLAYVGAHNHIPIDTVLAFIWGDSYLASNDQIDSTVKSVYAKIEV